MRPDITAYKKQCEIIQEAAQEWWYFVRDKVRADARTYSASRSLLRLYNALMQFDGDYYLRYRLILDAWSDFKGAAMRHCRTSFDTWGDIERHAAVANNIECKTLLDLRNAIEVKELTDDSNPYSDL